MIYTIGHSTRTIEDFVDILHTYEIRQVVDVRSLPYSRYAPQFNKEAIAESLRLAGMRYLHLKDLGGLRHPQKDSVNQGWKNASFRGYADYMQTPAFQEGIRTLIELTKNATTVIMCAEAVPWRCHRSLIADALLIREHHVTHILSKTTTRKHTLTPFACVQNGTLTYPKKGTTEAGTKGSRT